MNLRGYLLIDYTKTMSLFEYGTGVLAKEQGLYGIYYFSPFENSGEIWPLLIHKNEQKTEVKTIEWIIIVAGNGKPKTEGILDENSTSLCGMDNLVEVIANTLQRLEKHLYENGYPEQEKNNHLWEKRLRIDLSRVPFIALSFRSSDSLGTIQELENGTCQSNITIFLQSAISKFKSFEVLGCFEEKFTAPLLRIAVWPNKIRFYQQDEFSNLKFITCIQSSKQQKSMIRYIIFDYTNDWLHQGLIECFTKKERAASVWYIDMREENPQLKLAYEKPNVSAYSTTVVFGAHGSCLDMDIVKDSQENSILISDVVMAAKKILDQFNFDNEVDVYENLNIKLSVCYSAYDSNWLTEGIRDPQNPRKIRDPLDFNGNSIMKNFIKELLNAGIMTFKIRGFVTVSNCNTQGYLESSQRLPDISREYKHIQEIRKKLSNDPSNTTLLEDLDWYTREAKEGLKSHTIVRRRDQRLGVTIVVKGGRIDESSTEYPYGGSFIPDWF